MKRILLISVILVAMLLSACGSPTTTEQPEASTLSTTYTLSVSVSPSGAGSVSPSGGKYDSGLQVTLTATPASGNTFDYWDGAASGSSHTVTITMNSNKSTTAHFKAVETPAAPTPTPPPTPTPSPDYSRSNPVGIGIALTTKVNRTGGAAGKYTGIFGEYEVCLTLLETIRGDRAWQLIRETSMFADPPEPGFEYILAKVKFEYLTGQTPDTTFEVSPVWFKVVSMNGNEYDRPIGLRAPDPSIRVDLYPGASHEGWIAYPVTVDDTKPLMTIGRESDGTGGIWFKLY